MPSKEHDEIVALLRSLSGGPDPQPLTVEDSRERLNANGDLFPVPDGVDIEHLDLDGIPAERYRPAKVTTDATILYLHGGAYIAGSLRSHRPLCARIAAAAGTELVAVDYRLAPEHPHPAALDDASASYRWLLSNGRQPERVVLAGDSAGGGLAVALLLWLGATGGPHPAGAVLMSPWLDLTLSGESIISSADADPLLNADALANSAAAYAGADRRSPLVSPIYALEEDLAALPPLLILAGTGDILVDDSRTLARRASAAGVDVELEVEEGLIHVWPFLDGIPEAAAAMDRIGAWVSTILARSAEHRRPLR